MDELHPRLSALIDQARVAHDPSADDARRVATALVAVIPGFVPAALLAGAAAQSATEVVAQTAVGSSLKAAWLSGAATAKLLGALVLVAAGGAALTMKPRATDHPSRPPSPSVQQAASTPPVEPPALPPPEAVADAATRPPQVEPPARSTNPRAPASHRAPSELELIERAVSALHAGDTALAERWLQQHAARFPTGKLAEERTGLTLIALCEQGRTGEAEPLRQRFMAEAARSPLAGRVARACGER